MRENKVVVTMRQVHDRTKLLPLGEVRSVRKVVDDDDDKMFLIL